MKRAKWLLMNGIMASALWFGIAEGVPGARNIGLVMAWMVIVLSLVTASKDFREQMAKADYSPAVPPFVDGSFDACICALLLWHGYIVTGVAYAISWALYSAFCDAVKEIRARNKLAVEVAK